MPSKEATDQRIAGPGGESDASDLLGMRNIEATSVTPLHVSDVGHIFTARSLHRVRNPALYKGPHVLVRRTRPRVGLAAVLVDEDAVFPSGIIGFSGPPTDRPPSTPANCLAILALA